MTKAVQLIGDNVVRLHGLEPARRTLTEALATYIRNTKAGEHDRLRIAANVARHFNVNPYAVTRAAFA